MVTFLFHRRVIPYYVCVHMCMWHSFLSQLSADGHLSCFHVLVIASSSVQFSSGQFSCSVMSDSLWPHGLQHPSLPCPSPTPGTCSNCPSSQWCHPTIPSSVVPFSSCPQSFPASESFPKSQFFASAGQSIRAWASASLLPKIIQDWFPLVLTGLISLQSKGLVRIRSSNL